MVHSNSNERTMEATNELSLHQEDDLMPVLVQKGLVPVMDDDSGRHHHRSGDGVNKVTLSPSSTMNGKEKETIEPPKPSSKNVSLAKPPKDLPKVPPSPSGLEDTNATEIGDTGTSIVYQQSPADEEEGLSVAVMPSSLSRQSRPINSTSTPGAYAAFPGSDHIRQSHLDLSLVGATNSTELGGQGSTPDLPFARSNRDEGLAEAVPVREESPRDDLPGATQVDLEARELKQRQDERKRKGGLFALFLIVVVLVAAAIIAITSSGQNTSSSTTPIPSDHQQQPENITTSPSIAPSEADSHSNLGWVKTLPNSTQLSLQDPLSAQYRAFNWLTHHPNVTSMMVWRQRQLFALATVFFSLNGDEWPEVIRNDWMDYTRSECDWYSDIFSWVVYSFATGGYFLKGIDTNETTCNDMEIFNRLSIMLAGQKADPDRNPDRLPPEVVLLTDLEQISLKTLVANGPITNLIIPELSQLTNLRRLTVGSATLTGTIPLSVFDTLAELPSLEHFEIEESALSGTLPTQFSVLSNLKVFTLNAACGKQCTELMESRGLGNTSKPQMIGTIPDEWFQLSHMERFAIGGLASNITGSLPAAVGNLHNLSRLSVISELTGTIPTTLGKLTGLTHMKLKSNQFTGQIPSELGLVSRLHVLELQMNQLSGTIPASLFAGMLQGNNAHTINLAFNELTGAIPTELWFLTTLESIELTRNTGLEGQIPAGHIGSLSNLVKLDIAHNSFNGSIPFAEMGNLTELKILELQENAFTGTIGSDIGQLPRLKSINLADNQFLSGPIPREIANATRLNKILLQGNNFSGTIPKEFGQLAYLNELNLANNSQLGGDIPPELGKLDWLQKLSLSGTGLLGIVPNEVCALKEEGRLLEIQIDCSRVDCNCSCTCA